MSDLRLGLHARAVGLMVVVAVVCSCGHEQTRVGLQPVALPDGGAVYTVAVLDGADRLEVVAATPLGLFVHRNDSGPWRRIQPDWPTNRPDAPPSPLGQWSTAAESLNANHSERFTAHHGRLWMIAGMPASQDGLRVLSSEDIGRSWRRVALPGMATSGRREDASDPPQTDYTPSTPAGSAAAPAESPSSTSRLGQLRLLNFGRHGLYLISTNHLWRLAPDEMTTSGQSPWKPIDLTGIELDPRSSDPFLPTVLRHYLPATDSRPFELMTVLDESLHVYRRRADRDQWRQVVTLDQADRQLAGVNDSDTVFMLTTDGLFGSSKAADTWTPLGLPDLGQTNTQGAALQVLPPTNDAALTVLVALDTGQIFRSTDGADSWREVHRPDADRRTVTDFTYSARRNRLWAATSGLGVLRSLDRGQTWHAANDELQASPAAAMAINGNGGFLVGTAAGLFRLVGSSASGHWQMLQDRATTAIEVDRQSGVIIHGTSTGAIVRTEPDGKTTTAEAAPLDFIDDIVYRPVRLRGMKMSPQAIVDIARRPDSQQVFAWSAQEGPLRSLDDGISWTRMSLNSAFQSALSGSSLSNFTPGAGERMYLVSSPLDDHAPPQLWRSYSDGETWHAVSSVPQNDRPASVFLGRSARYSPEILFLAHRDRFGRSADGGNSWTELTGPWDDGQILTYQLHQREHLLTVATRHATNLLQVRNIDQDTPDIDEHILQWADGPNGWRNGIRRVSLNNDDLYVLTPNHILTGKLPDGRRKLPDGLAILATIASLLVLTCAAFIFVRSKA